MAGEKENMGLSAVGGRPTRKILVMVSEGKNTPSTYNMKEELKAKGYRWDRQTKSWYKVASSIEEAREIMEEIKEMGFLVGAAIEGKNIPEDMKYKREALVDGIYFFKLSKVGKFDEEAKEIAKKIYFLKKEVM